MPGPWDKYASVTGQSAPPWEKYATAPDTQTSGPWDDYAGAQPEPGDAIPGLRGMGLPEMPDPTPVALRPPGPPPGPAWVPAPVPKPASAQVVPVKAPASYQIQAEEPPVPRTIPAISAQRSMPLPDPLRPVPADITSKEAIPALKGLYEIATLAPWGVMENLKPDVNPQAGPIEAGARGSTRGLMEFGQGLIEPQNAAIIVATALLPPAGAALAGVYFTHDMLKSAVEQSPEIARAVMRGDWDTVGRLSVHVIGAATMATLGIKHAMAGARPVLAERMGIPAGRTWTEGRQIPAAVAAPINPVTVASMESERTSPSGRYQDVLRAIPDDDLATMRAEETNPFAKGLITREIQARATNKEWNPTQEPASVDNRATRRAAVEPEMGPQQSDFENAAWQTHERPWSELSPEEQTAVRTSVAARWAENPSDSTLIDPELDRIAGILGGAEYRRLSEADQRAVRELRDESLRGGIQNVGEDVGKNVGGNVGKSSVSPLESTSEALREAFSAKGQRETVPPTTERAALRGTLKPRDLPPPDGPPPDIGRGEAQSPITIDRVAKAFGSKVEVSQLDNGDFSARLRDGRHVIVQRDLDAIHVSSETLQRDYGREMREGEQAVGRYVRIDRDGLIQLAKRGGDAEILDHEVFHAAVDLVLTPHEKAQLLKKWGSEEAAAEAYSAWKPGTPAGTLFAKIAAYFRRLCDQLFRPHQETLRKIRSGEVWERGATRESTPESERGAVAAGAPWTIRKDDLVPWKDTLPRPKKAHDTSGGWSEEEINARTLRNRAAEDVAPEVIHHPVGTWGVDSTGELMQLREIALDDPKLVITENVPSAQNQTVQKYIRWAQEGSEIPALHGLETDKGNVKIIEGHHRIAAIKALGGDKAKVWVTLTENKMRPSGVTMPEGITHEEVVRRALASGEQVPPEVASEYAHTERAALRAEPRPDQERERERTILSPNVEESYINRVRTSGLSPETAREYQAQIERVLREDPERRVEGFKELQGLAREVNPVRIMERGHERRGETMRPEELLAARNMSRTVQEEIGRRSEEMRNLPLSTSKEARAAHQEQIDRLLDDQQRLLRMILPQVSQAGRNLAYLRIEAEQSLSPAYWLGRIRRQLNLEPDKPIPNEERIISTLADAQRAEERAIERVTELPQRAPQRKTMKPAVERRTIELNDEERFAQAKRRELKRIESEMQGRRLLQILNPEDRARLLEDPDVIAARERLHQWRRDNRPLKTSDERIAAAIRRERARLSRQLEGEQVTASPEQLTPAERTQVLSDPTIQSLRDQLRARAQQRTAERRATAPTDEEKIAHARELELGEIARRTELARLGLREPPPRPPSKWELTPAQRLAVDRDPGVIAARRRFLEVARETLKTHPLDVVLAYRRANLLTAIATHGRNFVGNLAFQLTEEASHGVAALPDRVLSHWTGIRTIGGVDLQAMANASRAAATQGLREAVDMVRHGVTDQQMAQFDFRTEINTGNVIFDTYVNTVFRTMSAADRIFKIYAYERSLAEQMKLAKADRATDEMVMQAWGDADIATFNNRNAIADWVQSGNRHPGIKFTVGMLMPFVRTPTNIVLRGLEYTPIVASAKMAKFTWDVRKGGWTPELQKKFSIAFGRGAVGTTVIALGFWLAGKDLMTGARPQNPNEARSDETAGRNWGSVKIGDGWYQLSLMPPFGTLLTVGATLYDALHERERSRDTAIQKTWRTAGGVTGAAIQSLADMPMLQGGQTIQDIRTEPLKKTPQIAASMAGSFIPASSFVRSVALAGDASRREMRAQSPVEEFSNRIQANIPIARNQLPPRIDALGVVQEQDRLAGISPFQRRTALENRDRVRKAIVDEQVSIGVPQRKPGEGEEAYQWRMRALGAAKEYMLRNLVTSGYYQSLDSLKSSKPSDERAEAMKKAMRAGTDLANEYLGRSYGRLNPHEQEIQARQAWEALRQSRGR